VTGHPSPPPFGRAEPADGGLVRRQLEPRHVRRPHAVGATPASAPPGDPSIMGVTPRLHAVPMHFTNPLPRSATATATLPTASATRPTATACLQCTTGHRHCHGTLVLHADGSAHCDEALRCEGRHDLHDWWVPCTDLGCGCTGDEQPQPMLLAA